MIYGFQDKPTAERVIDAARLVELSQFGLSPSGDVPETIPYVAQSPDGGLGLPAKMQYWDTATQSFVNVSDQVVRIVQQPLAMYVGTQADGTAVYATTFEDEYPYPGYGSYDDGDGNGSTVSHDATINIGCNATTGNIIGDVVRYTIVALVRRGRLTMSISMEVLEEDKILVETECKRIIDLATLTLTCVDGVPTIDYDDDYVRSIVCKACP